MTMCAFRGTRKECKVNMKKTILIISSCIIIPIITIIIVYFVSFKPVNIGYIEPLPTNVICVGDEYVIDYKKLSEKLTTE